MQEIRDLKTRDASILADTIREMMNVHGHHNPIGDLDLLTQAVERLQFDSYIIYSKELRKWVFTDILDDDLFYQEFFRNLNFVIVETDLNMALARGIHYLYHKKVRP